MDGSTTAEVAKVSVRTTANGFEKWKIDLEVPKATTIAALRQILLAPPHSLKFEPANRILKRYIKSNLLGATKDDDKVSSELVVLDLEPAPTFSEPAKVEAKPSPEEFEVRVLTSFAKCEDWEVRARVPPGTTIAALKKLLMKPPHNLKLKPDQKVCQRMHKHGIISGLKETDQVCRELLLLNFNPYEEVDSPTPGPTPKKEEEQPSRPVKEYIRQSREESQQAKMFFEHLKKYHSEQPPLDRKVHSWARAIGFAETVLNLTGHFVSRGTSEKPQVVWVLNCKEEIEVALMKVNVFAGTNWQGHFPTEVILWGPAVEDSGPTSMSFLNQPGARTRSANYSSVDVLGSAMPPDFVVLFMPNMGKEKTGHCACSGPPVIPQSVIAATRGAPVVVTLRSRVPPKALSTLGGKGKNIPILFTPVRNPFSAQAGRPDCEYDDNGWIVGVQDVKTLQLFLELDMMPPPSEVAHEDDGERERRVPALFWGIIDLKYDSSAPMTERVKMLETGDGRTSRFSGAGSEILKHYRGKYRLEEVFAGAGKHAVVSANKKLTHDLMDAKGYGHLLPRQLCFPRVYTLDLARRIVEGLGLTGDDIVVLKLCNRTRAAGVLPVPIDELDEVLEEVLQPPAGQDLERWLASHRAMGSAATLDVGYGCWEEQVRHWWSNECPFFVAEKFAASVPVEWEGKYWDATMRVAFVLRRKDAAKGRHNSHQASCGHDMPPAEELDVDWIGGYWKLPKVDLSSPKLRDRIISAARTSGTAHVDFHVLTEVYAAMADSIQLLFGGSEPTAATLADSYKAEPTMAAYLVARLAVAMKEISSGRRVMNMARNIIDQAEDGPSTSCAKSFVRRGFGVLDAMTPPGRWEEAGEHFTISKELLPTNASTLYLLGMAHMEREAPEQAIELMSSALMLDLDFKAPYVNLGVAYLRLKRFDAAVDVSEACLKRHPDSPQCHYNIGVAYYQKALLLENGNPQPRDSVKQEYERLRKRGLQELLEARDSDEAQRMLNRSRCESPWLDDDDRMLEAMRPHRSQLGKPRDRRDRLSRAVEITPTSGWKFFGWRT